MIVVVGLGQLGGLFAHGFLRCSEAVVPALRATDLAALALEISEPRLVLVAVGEADLDATLRSLPVAWRARVMLVQNELFASQWSRHEVVDPTIACVWFEKKKNKPLHVIVPPSVSGPESELVGRALGALDIEHLVVESAAMPLVLALKTIYILTSNIAGLVVGGTVGELLSEHEELTRKVVRDANAICEARGGFEIGPGVANDAFAHYVDADPAHVCKGRSAPARLARCLTIAHELGVEIPTMREIAAKS